MARAKFWDDVDWSKSNHQIAQETGRALNTVEKRRVAMGKTGMGAKKVRSDKGVSKPQPHLARQEYQALATQKAKQSPKAGRFETNTKAKIWTLKDSNNRTHTFTNLMHFVRQNPHLFDASDVIWRKKANGVEWCRASNGLSSLSRQKNPAQTWKGWVLISVTDKSGH